MVHGIKEIGPNRFRETFGRYFEEFKVGDIYEHRPGRTITQTDNTWFTLLTMNQHPLHFDQEYAGASEFGRILVNSCLTLSLVTGMSVSDVSQKTVDNLGWDDVRLTGPVFVGDTLYAKSEVMEKRLSKSREHEGIVRVRFQVFAGYRVERTQFPKIVRIFRFLACTNDFQIQFGGYGHFPHHVHR